MSDDLSDVSSLLSEFDIDDDDDDDNDDEFLSKLDMKKAINENAVQGAEKFLEKMFDLAKKRLGSNEEIKINFESKYKIEQSFRKVMSISQEFNKKTYKNDLLS